MFAIGSRLDEFGLVDDSVDVAMLADEVEEHRECAAFAVEAVCRIAQRRADRVTNLRRHVADERLEQPLFRFKVGVERAKGDTGALGNSDDRAFCKTALAKFLPCRIEDLAHRALTPRGSRRLRGSGGAELRPFLHLHPHPVPPTEAVYIRKLKHGSTFIMTLLTAGAIRAAARGRVQICALFPHAPQCSARLPLRPFLQLRRRPSKIRAAARLLRTMRRRRRPPRRAATRKSS